MTRRFTLEAATDLAARAIRAAGASHEVALSLARATVSADAHGKGSSGFSHLMDYLAALRAGRIVGDPEPVVTSPAPAAIHCDARGGIAQAGFDRAFDDDLRPLLDGQAAPDISTDMKCAMPANNGVVDDRAGNIRRAIDQKQSVYCFLC